MISARRSSSRGWRRPFQSLEPWSSRHLGAIIRLSSSGVWPSSSGEAVAWSADPGGGAKTSTLATFALCGAAPGGCSDEQQGLMMLGTKSGARNGYPGLAHVWSYKDGSSSCCCFFFFVAAALVPAPNPRAVAAWEEYWSRPDRARSCEPKWRELEEALILVAIVTLLLLIKDGTGVDATTSSWSMMVQYTTSAGRRSL